MKAGPSNPTWKTPPWLVLHFHWEIPLGWRPRKSTWISSELIPVIRTTGFSLGNAQAWWNTKPFPGITSTFPGELPRWRTRINSLLNPGGSIPTKSNGGGLVLPESVSLHNSQPSLPNIPRDVKRGISRDASRGEVGPECARPDHHDHLPQGIIVRVLPGIPHDPIRAQHLPVFNGISAALGSRERRRLRSGKHLEAPSGTGISEKRLL